MKPKALARSSKKQSPKVPETVDEYQEAADKEEDAGGA